MANTNTADYANLSLSSDRTTVSAGTSFHVTVSPTIKAIPAHFNPKTEYKLFVSLPPGVKVVGANAVKEASGKLHVVDFRSSWDGGTNEDPLWRAAWDVGTGSQRVYDSKLLANWDSDGVADQSSDAPMGWTIELELDGSYNFAETGYNATVNAWLFAKQSNAVKPSLAKYVTLKVSAAGPSFKSITIEHASVQQGLSVVTVGTQQLTINAALATAQVPSVTHALVRWREGDGDWRPAHPLEVGIAGDQLSPFTIDYAFSTARSADLAFQCAIPVTGGDPVWGATYKVPILAVSDLLYFVAPAITRVGNDIKLTGVMVDFPHAGYATGSLEISFDGERTWSSASDYVINSDSPFSIDKILSRTDFSKGVYLRAKDVLNRQSPSTVVPLSVDSFIEVTWDTLTEGSLPNQPHLNLNLGQAFEYVAVVRCLGNVILPPSKIELLVPEDEVGIVAGSNTWSVGAFSKLEIWLPAKILLDTDLVDRSLARSTLVITNDELFDQTYESKHQPNVIIYSPPPNFVLTKPLSGTLLTNKNALNFKGDFRPPVKDPTLIQMFVSVDGIENKEHFVLIHPAEIVQLTTNGFEIHPAEVVQLTTNGFEILLDPKRYAPLANDGIHHVAIMMKYRDDRRETPFSVAASAVQVTIANAAPSFPRAEVEIDATNLKVTGQVVGPASAEDPVEKAWIYWDGTGEKQDRQPLTLTSLGGGAFKFADSLPVANFDGWLAPRVLAITKSGAERSQNLYFPTAENMLNIAVEAGGAAVPNGGQSTPIASGTVALTIAVTSRVGFSQKLNMHVLLGPGLTNGATFVSVSGPSVQKSNGWDGDGATQIAQTEKWEKNKAFTIKIEVDLSVLSQDDITNLLSQDPSLSEDDLQKIAISFVDSGNPQMTISASDERSAVVFEGRLLPQ